MCPSWVVCTNDDNPLHLHVDAEFTKLFRFHRLINFLDILRETKQIVSSAFCRQGNGFTGVE